MIGLVLLRLRYGGRRLFNALVGPKKPEGGERGATRRKRNVGAFLLLLFPLLFFGQFFFSEEFLATLARTADEEVLRREGRLPLPEAAWRALHDVRSMKREAEELATLGRPSLRSEVDRLEYGSKRLLNRIFSREATARFPRSLLEARWNAQGLEGFGPLRERGTRQGRKDPRRLEASRMGGLDFRSLLSVHLCCWLLAIFLADLGLGLQSSGGSTWNLSWLMTFPSSTTAIHFSEIVAGSSFALWLLFIVVPMLFVSHASRMASLPALLYTSLGFLALLLVMGSFRFLVQILIWTRLSPSKGKNLQALCSGLGGFGSLACLMPMTRPELPGWLREGLLAGRRHFPWLPTDLLLGLGREGAVDVAALTGLLLATIAVVGTGLILARRLTRNGLIGSGDSPLGAPTSLFPTGSSYLHGVAWKECLLLRRDRNLATQSFLLPFGIIAVNFLASPELLPMALSDVAHTGALAFGLGAYVLIFSALSALSLEGESLWILTTTPEGVFGALRHKARLWGLLTLFYGALVFGAALHVGRLPLGSLAAAALQAAIGLLLFGHLAVAMAGIAGPQRQGGNPGASLTTRMLFLLYTALYGALFYLPTAALRLSWTAIACLLVLSYWERLKDEAPYLLDPTESPPPRFALGDALGCLAAFVFLQQLLLGLLSDGRGRLPMAALPAIYTVTGLCVLGGLWAQIRGRNLGPLVEILGLRPRSDATPRPRAWLRAAGTGFVVALLGLAWHSFAPAPPSAAPAAFSPGWWLGALLLVVLAPAVEELLFRGLLHRRLRALLPPRQALLASAATFALIHPPHAFVPTFFLGLATAFEYERTGRLSAAMVTHGSYNLALMAFVLW